MVAPQVREAVQAVFASKTQAYREVLLGCVVARMQDKSINIRQPYADQGPHAFSGRSLDERVINPFLRDRRIPCSKGPYLSVFRRSVQFADSTRSGLRDQKGYDAFLTLLARIESMQEDSSVRDLLTCVLYRFAELRESASIPLSRLQRISLDQYDTLISGLLATPSGGRFPVLLAVATFNAIKESFSLDWQVSWQGINVSDAASGAGGDITISSGSRTLMAAEVTERTVDRSRMVATFDTKIAPTGIEDYLFLVRPYATESEARQQASRYFAQGHDVNFLDIKEWMVMVLATIGVKGRAFFGKALVELLASPEVPSVLKVAWNEQIATLTAG